jgi:uncharacterized protein YndB with AHSA1/START domain
VTEILIDVDFGHPPERVWRALTDRTVLSEWFMRTDLEPYVGRRFRLAPDGLLGLAGPLEGELVEVVAPRKLVMLLRGEQMHSRVTWELVPLPAGCRLRMSHTGFIGVKGSLRRKELQRAYDRMLSDRLPVVLESLAAGKPVSRPAAPVDAADPTPPAPAPPEAPASASVGTGGDDPPRRRGVLGWLAAVPHRRRGQILAVAGSVLLAVLTAAVITGLGVPGFVPPLGAAPSGGPGGLPASAGSSARGVPPPGATEGASAPTAPDPTSGAPVPPALRPGVTGTVAPTPQPEPEPSVAPLPGDPAWRAAYRTLRSSASGFTGTITVTNNTNAAAAGWVVRVTLSADARLGTVRRANGAQSGTTVTFTSKNPRQRVGPGASLTLEFDVSGASGPTGCSIEGGSCTGIPG